MIRYTAVSTGERKANIVEQTNSIQYDQSETLRAFGINVDDKKFLQVPARRLPPPNIQYSNGVATPSKGQWRMEFGNKNLNFLEPVNCLKWCVLNTDTYLKGSYLDSFIGEVCRKIRTKIFYHYFRWGFSVCSFFSTFNFLFQFHL